MSELNLEKKLRENSQALGLKSLADFNTKFAEELRSNLTPKPEHTKEKKEELEAIAAELKTGTSLIDLIEAPFKPKKPKPKEAPEP